MGNLNIIDGARFPDTIPRLSTIDAMESDGSLLLVEPGHTANPWQGMPATGTTVPNLLRRSSNALTKTTEAGAPLTWNAANGTAVERTRRGGVNILNRTSATNYTDSLFNIAIPDGVASYINANYTHRFFASVWLRTTAVKDPALPADAPAVLNMQSETVFGMQLNNSVKPRYSSNYTSPFNFAEKTGLWRINAEYNALRDMSPAKPPFLKQAAFQGGNRMLPGVSNAGKTGSYVFYRTYLEDLTVSGRTYAEADAIDNSLYTQAFGAGGRYAGDTFATP